ncbi:phospholipase A-2-activating protein [Condylostylus longicornis]|uniref:phospholipase A-2-activating protein n=1 Tax=Condylostylus longicornis TaxID=2530218 RepID=UPI00244E147A|nr:phospholipase A-2-activating protein [Condylostylus longicornis]
MDLPSLNEYKLSCELLGHSMDVRTVCCVDDNTIISGSRDKTVKIWQRIEKDKFDVVATHSRHKNFVACVYYLESENWICTGSNDSSILIYRVGCANPFAELRGHEDTVCSLYRALGQKTIISGSWDKTAIVWSINDDGTFTYNTLKGHTAAVWSVGCFLMLEKYITASADKNIIFWNTNGEKLRILKGHTDCIRSLIPFEDGSLVSCGNDAIIKCWSSEGDCIRELSGHTNFIYSISKNPNLGEHIFVSSGEDGTVRLWSLAHGQLGEELTLPVQSVWSVACLNNGDIVTGNSDGVVRIFTRDLARTAENEKLKQFQVAVETIKLEKLQTIGGYNKDSLPGPDILTKPGAKEGQTKMIREVDGKVSCYIWENNNWNKLGDVVGASGGSQANSGKVLYMGKEYDYVFSVDVSENEPPKKLPYNIGEDPWLAAQNFIDKNNLPQVYLDQVANFIINNSNAETVEKKVVTEYQDPFTGESRYIPGVNAEASSYNFQNFISAKPTVKHFPITTFFTLDTCDIGKVFDKLREFNTQAGAMKVSEQTLKFIIELVDKNEKKPYNVELLTDLLSWPEDILFPVLDITRLAIRDEKIFFQLKPTLFMENILRGLHSNLPNQLMTVRCFVNLMGHPLGRDSIENNLTRIIDGVKNLKKGSSNLQIAIATFYLNLSITQVQDNITAQDKCGIIFEGVVSFLEWATESEAWYRCMQMLGNLSCTNYRQILLAQIISVDYVIKKIRELANSSPEIGCEKTSECAKALISLF